MFFKLKGKLNALLYRIKNADPFLISFWVLFLGIPFALILESFYLAFHYSIFSYLGTAVMSVMLIVVIINIYKKVSGNGV